MGSLSHTLRIAMLNADVPVPNVAARASTYGAIFHNLLAEAARRIVPGLKVESADYDVLQGEYPASTAEFDAIIVTGSRSSAYWDEPWIHKLDAYLKTTYQTLPHVKIFGSCFGHQLVCQSLLGEAGCTVEKSPAGWELGVHEIALADEFRSAFPFPGKSTAAKPETLRLQFVHADHVTMPTGGLPAGWVSLGETEKCSFQGVFRAGRVLTYQGHFEFDRFVNTETLKVFGAEWEPGFYQRAMELIDADDDAGVAAEMVLRFLM